MVLSFLNKIKILYNKFTLYKILSYLPNISIWSPLVPRLISPLPLATDHKQYHNPEQSNGSLLIKSRFMLCSDIIISAETEKAGIFVP